MRSWAQTEGIFPAHEVELLHKATQMVAWLPEKIDGEWVRCHELTRVIGARLGLPVHDGFYGFVEHSWLWLGSVDGPWVQWRLPNILDVYVPGQLPQVQIKHVASGLPMPYVHGDIEVRVRQEVVDKLNSLLDMF